MLLLGGLPGSRWPTDAGTPLSIVCWDYYL